MIFGFSVGFSPEGSLGFSSKCFGLTSGFVKVLFGVLVGSSVRVLSPASGLPSSVVTIVVSLWGGSTFLYEVPDLVKGLDLP